jgi:uncharacterized protein YukE
MPTVSPLAAFCYDWIGGNIRGLHRIAETLYAYLPRVQNLVGTLSVTARDLTSDSPDGWQGTAASAFTAAWRKQAATAAALEDYVTCVALAINGLAVELSQIENALEDDAYDVSKHGVQIGTDGSVQGYSGVQGLEWATSYTKVLEQAQAAATQAREAAARRLYSLYQQVMNTNPHPNGADTATMSGLLADLLAAPTAARREVSVKLKTLTGKDLNFKEEIAEANHTGELLPQKTFDESAKVVKELEEVKEELSSTGRTESALSKLLDTRVSDVSARLQGAAGEGRHVSGNTPEDLQAVADHEPGALEKILNIGDDIPVVDVVTTAAGTAVGTYYDVKGGQSLGSALTDEAISNTAGTVAANVAGGMVGAEFGAELGSAAGPVGIAVGAIVGYGVGDLTHNLLVEPWGQDMHKYGAVLGTLYGIGHSEAATVDNARELAVGTGHDIEHYWDDIF